MTYWKSPDFKALQKEWYGRLEKGGFRDAERLVGDELLLVRPADDAYKHVSDEVDRVAKEMYYTQLAQHVHRASFKRIVDWLVMSWYSEGKRINDIVADLELVGFKRNRWSVRFIIRRYEAAWGMKEYTRQELHLK